MIFIHKNKWLKLLAFVVMLFSFHIQTKAQQVTVDASIDSLQLLIGQQAKIKLEISLDANQKLELPSLRDTIVQGIEILDVAKPDTQLLNNNKRMLINQEYTITSFDSALYYIPPFEVKVDDVSYQSKTLALKVYSVPVDTLNPDNFYGPKGIREETILWEDVSGIVWRFLLFALLGGVICYLFVRLMNNKPIIRKIKVKQKLPAHISALQDIERIKADKHLKVTEPKLYYTELTDVIRTYLAERFAFNAMEMTSNEIIDKLMEIKEKEEIQELRVLFQTADLVKFAKYLPLMNENDMNLVNAIEFINQTKVEIDPQSKPEPTEITVMEKRSKASRITLQMSMGIIAIVMLVLLFQISKGIYNLF